MMITADDLSCIARSDSEWQPFVSSSRLYIAAQNITIIAPITDTNDVFMANIDDHDGKYAVKCVSMKNYIDRYYALKEMRRWQSFSHPNIVQLMGVCILQLRCMNEPCLALCSPMSPNPSLDIYLKRMAPLTEAAVIKIMIGAVSGICNLHENRHIHGDVKTANIVMNNNGEGQLIDFGNCSDNIFGTIRSGTVGYEAPEMKFACLRGPFGYSLRVDIWSLGIVLCELLHGKLAWYRLNPSEVAGDRPVVPKDTSPAVRRIIDQCLDLTPSNRPSATQLLAALSDLLDDVPMTAPVVAHPMPRRQRSANAILVHAHAATAMMRLGPVKRRATSIDVEKLSVNSATAPLVELAISVLQGNDTARIGEKSSFEIGEARDNGEVVSDSIAVDETPLLVNVAYVIGAIIWIAAEQLVDLITDARRLAVNMQFD